MGMQPRPFINHLKAEIKKDEKERYRQENPVTPKPWAVKQEEPSTSGNRRRRS